MLDDVTITPLQDSPPDVATSAQTSDLETRATETSTIGLITSTESDIYQNDTWSEPGAPESIGCDFNSGDVCGFSVWYDNDDFYWVKMPRAAVPLLEMTLEWDGKHV